MAFRCSFALATLSGTTLDDPDVSWAGCEYAVGSDVAMAQTDKAVMILDIFT
ncbi:hypothetical protein PUN4_650005 [Paraburkholderia unamae]|nr:hypothetical protein PUN4_650005 [Paraburkholderia unamae]